MWIKNYRNVHYHFDEIILCQGILLIQLFIYIYISTIMSLKML